MNVPLRALGDVCEIVMGQAPSGESYNQEGIGYPLIAGAGDFCGDRPLAKKHTSTPTKLSEAGDVVVSIRATIGTKVLSDTQYCLGRGVAGLRPRAELSTRYLWYWLSHAETTLASKGRGATFPQVSKSDIAELLIPLPTISEQRRIAAILDKADALRRKQQRALELLDALTNSIFLEIFSDAVQFPLVSFDHLLRSPLRNGISPAQDGKIAGKVLTLSAITSGEFRAEAWKKAMFSTAPSPQQRVEEGQFLICRGNGNKNMVGIGVASPTTMTDTAFPDTIIAADVDSSIVDLHFLELAWNSPSSRRQIEQLARTTNGTYKVNQSVLGQVKLPLPPKEKQNAFGEARRAIKEVKKRQRTGADQLATLFTSLQHRAFSGQL